MGKDYDAITVNPEGAVFIPEIWASEALVKLRSNLNLGKTIRRDLDDEVARYGDTIKIPKTGALSLNTKTKNKDVTKQDPTATEVEVKLDQHKEVTFLVEDPAAAMAKQDIRARYIDDAVAVVAEGIESAIAAQYAYADSHIDFDTSSEDTIQDSMLEIRKHFTDVKANRLMPRHLYGSSSLTNELLAVDKFTKANEYGSRTPVVDGILGDMYGIGLFESQLVAESGSPVTEHNLAYVSDAIALVMRGLPTHGRQMGVDQTLVTDPESGFSIRITTSYNPDALGIQVTLDVLYGIKTVRPEFLLDVRL